MCIEEEKKNVKNEYRIPAGKTNEEEMCYPEIFERNLIISINMHLLNH